MNTAAGLHRADTWRWFAEQAGHSIIRRQIWLLLSTTSVNMNELSYSCPDFLRRWTPLRLLLLHLQPQLQQHAKTSVGTEKLIHLPIYPFSLPQVWSLVHRKPFVPPRLIIWTAPTNGSRIVNGSFSHKDNATASAVLILSPNACRLETVSAIPRTFKVVQALESCFTPLSQWQLVIFQSTPTKLRTRNPTNILQSRTLSTRKMIPSSSPRSILLVANSSMFLARKIL